MRISLDGSLLHVIRSYDLGHLVIDLNDLKLSINHVTPHLIQQGNDYYLQSDKVQSSRDNKYMSYTTSTTITRCTKFFVDDRDNNQLFCFGHFVLDNVRYFSEQNKLIIISVLWCFQNELFWMVSFHFVCELFDDCCVTTTYGTTYYQTFFGNITMVDLVLHF